MFNQTISNPISPLTRTYVNSLMRISQDPDYSLICLATALIKPRVQNYNGITGAYRYAADVQDVITRIGNWNKERSESPKELIDNVPAFYYMLLNLSGDGINSIRNYAKDAGLKELIAVENFIAQQLNNSAFLVFINPENNAAFIVVSSTSNALYHLSISFISLLYPTLFKSHPLTKEETEISKSLTNKTTTNFIEKTSAVLQYMKADLLRQELSQCFRGFRQGRINRCRQELENVNSRIDSIMSDYHHMMEKYNELIVQFEGLQVVNNEERNQEEQEAIDYLSSCPRIHDIQYSDGTLYFCADNLLTNFDLNKWNNAVRRNNIYDSYRLSEDSVFKDKAKRKLLLDNIFNQKPLLYVRMKGSIELRISVCDMIAQRGQLTAEENASLKDYITNPHFKIHGCPGRNREQISQCLRRADIMSAIECSIAAVGSVNIDETEYTFRPFLQEVLTSKNKIIQNNEGLAMTPEEALLWLSKQNLNNHKDCEDEIVIPF